MLVNSSARRCSPFKAIVILGTAIACGTAPADELTVPITIPLHAARESGVGGARLTPMGDRTRIEIVLREASQHAMPVHVHDGLCTDRHAQPRYVLESAVDGMSSTVVPASLDSLIAGTTVIDVHASANGLENRAACGLVKRRP